MAEGAGTRLQTGATARAARAAEWGPCRELVEAVGHDPELFDILTRADPEHRPEYVRVIDVTGFPVAIALVVPRWVLLGGQQVEGAVITLVGTHHAHRGRGLARLLLEDTIAFVRARGFRLALLYGAPELYGRFGFVSCLGAYATTWDAGRSVGEGRPDLLWRPVNDADVPTLTELYAGATARTPCAVVRPAEPWVWRERGAPRWGIQAAHEPGAPLRSAWGMEAPAPQVYVRWAVEPPGAPPGSFCVLEVGASDRESLLAALRWSTARARELGCREVRFVGPPDHPFARLACLSAGATVTVRPPRAGQVAVTNRGLLMADLAPALARRAEAAGLGPGTGLVLDVATKRFDLLVAGDRVRVLGGRAGPRSGSPVTRLSVEAFTLLLVGQAGGEDLEGLPGVEVAPSHREALAGLFPRGYPQWVPAPYWGGFPLEA